MSDNASGNTVSPLAFLDQILQDLLKENDQTSEAVKDSNNSPTSTTENPEQVQETPKTTVKKRSQNPASKRKPAASHKITTAAEPATDFWKEWNIMPISDAPSISWTDFDSGYQHTVQNPSNYGSSLLKISLFEGGVPRHISAVCLYPGTEVYNSLEQLLSQVENMWVERKTGRAKLNNIVRSRMPLATWRYNILTDYTIQDGVVVPVKRKRATPTDCIIPKQDGSATVVPKQKRSRPSV